MKKASEFAESRYAYMDTIISDIKKIISEEVDTGEELFTSWGYIPLSDDCSRLIDSLIDIFKYEDAISTLISWLDEFEWKLCSNKNNRGPYRLVYKYCNNPC